MGARYRATHLEFARPRFAEALHVTFEPSGQVGLEVGLFGLECRLNPCLSLEAEKLQVPDAGDNPAWRQTLEAFGDSSDDVHTWWLSSFSSLHQLTKMKLPVFPAWTPRNPTL